MRYRLISIVSLSLFLSLGSFHNVRAQDDTPAPETVVGRVSGQVVNLSFDGGRLDGVPVVLYGLEDFAVRETYTTTISADGTFVFESIGLVSGHSYIATLEYENVDYGSTFVEFDGAQEALQLDIEVYEAVTSSDPIQVSRLHVIVDFAEGWMRVSELYIFDNRSDRVYTGNTGNPEEGTLELPVPANAQQPTLERGMGESMVAASSSAFEIPGGFVDTLPVRPGSASQQLMVTYDIPYEDNATVSHPLVYPAASVSLILPDIGLSVDSELLESAGQRAMQGTPFVEWEATNLEAGQILTFEISGKPDLAALAASQGSSPSMPTDTGIIESPLFVRAGDNGTTWAIAIGSLVLSAGIAARFWNRSRTGFHRGRRDDLLQGIVDLDTAYEQGAVSEARYEYEREMLKAELRQWYEGTQEPAET
jgi:hypothetical protein